MSLPSNMASDVHFVDKKASLVQVNPAVAFNVGGLAGIPSHKRGDDSCGVSCSILPHQDQELHMRRFHGPRRHVTWPHPRFSHRRPTKLRQALLAAQAPSIPSSSRTLSAQRTGSFGDSPRAIYYCSAWKSFLVNGSNSIVPLGTVDVRARRLDFCPLHILLRRTSEEPPGTSLVGSASTAAFPARRPRVSRTLCSWKHQAANLSLVCTREPLLLLFSGTTGFAS